MHLTNILTTLLVVSLGAARPNGVGIPETAAIEPRETDTEATDRLLFDTPMSTFLDAKRLLNPSTLDWTDNGCGAKADDVITDHPDGFDFLPACQRHDFGYRNYKKQGRCDDSDKAKIDQNFRDDMDRICGAAPGFIKKLQCMGYAEVYYLGVRVGGDLC
ncbi:uncharacterized protein AB675_6170 [Cyphellophora attinorum]|uniref:Secretory phospholipase A2 n=1 Tax=Cyphellophora attinorum TaxID=1664694 RepID=A0A0N0NQC0_9EURO|nr:uncharacterized protein AB675_6170 [Phialophora attinorum]KPI43731.1 hypothetical protein AB675_6170 [Phialophora attinorum]